MKTLMFVLLLFFCSRGQSQFTDQLAGQVQQTWMQAFPTSTILPGIGLPSQNGQNWMILTHKIGSDPVMMINGQACRNPLCVNALFSSEWTGGNFLNMYEIMVEDVPGVGGQPSSGEIYVQALAQQGLNIEGVHFHWFGHPTLMAAIHHKNYGMNPVEFSQKTIAALQTYLNYSRNLRQYYQPYQSEITQYRF